MKDSEASLSVWPSHRARAHKKVKNLRKSQSMVLGGGVEGASPKRAGDEESRTSEREHFQLFWGPERLLGGPGCLQLAP